MEHLILTPAEIADITKLAFKQVMPRSKIVRVEVNRTGLTLPADLGIAVILSGKGSVRLTGKQLQEIRNRIASDLSQKGEERFPYLRILTAQEARSLTS